MVHARARLIIHVDISGVVDRISAGVLESFFLGGVSLDISASELLVDNNSSLEIKW